MYFTCLVLHYRMASELLSSSSQDKMASLVKVSQVHCYIESKRHIISTAQEDEKYVLWACNKVKVTKYWPEYMQHQGNWILIND